MFRLPKQIFSLGAGALALGVLMLAAPRAAHAIAAALVQVTNTTANPAITQSTATQASQVINLGSQGNSSLTFTQTFHEAIPPFSTPYLTPAAQSLVITDIDISGSACGAGAAFEITSPATTPIYWYIPPGTTTNHFSYRSGLVIPPSTGLEGQTNCNIVVLATGYLTAN
jgi:hypothetical protein